MKKTLSIALCLTIATISYGFADTKQCYPGASDNYLAICPSLCSALNAGGATGKGTKQLVPFSDPAYFCYCGADDANHTRGMPPKVDSDQNAKEVCPYTCESKGMTWDGKNWDSSCSKGACNCK